jgi:hypothetical protein
MKPGDVKKLRIGFLLNSNTLVKNINYQGKDTTRPDDNGNLCGGGAFETPGCVSPGFGDGVGTKWTSKRKGCYDHTGKRNDLITGDGKGVENVTIKNVRLNSLLLPSDPALYKKAKGSQIAVWVAMTKDGSATKKVKVKNLVSMLTRGDGINFHGNVQDSIVEDCHIENTGDDIYAVWGAYAENSAGNIFKNNVGKNPGVVRSYFYGVCIAVYGAKDMTFVGNKCYDVKKWNRNAKNSNSCMAYVHDNWFGAVYPEGNAIKFQKNEYLYLDGTIIMTADRPHVRSDKRSLARISSDVQSVKSSWSSDFLANDFSEAANQFIVSFDASQGNETKSHFMPWWVAPMGVIGMLSTASIAMAFFYLICKRGKREVEFSDVGSTDEETVVE